MKKITFVRLFAPLLLAMLLTGCGSKTLSSDEVQPETSQSHTGIISELQPGSESNEISPNKYGKVLIAYYSFSGNTEKVANVLKDMTGGEIFRIEPDFDYNRSDLETLVQKQIDEGFKPKLKNSVSDIGSYDLIFVGSPTWWFSPAPPVSSFLSRYDLRNKKVIPFCTYISEIGEFFTKFEEACPSGTKVLKGRDFISSGLKDTDNVKQVIEAWLNEIAQSE